MLLAKYPTVKAAASLAFAGGITRPVSAQLSRQTAKQAGFGDDLLSNSLGAFGASTLGALLLRRPLARLGMHIGRRVPRLGGALFTGSAGLADRIGDYGERRFGNNSLLAKLLVGGSGAAAVLPAGLGYGMATARNTARRGAGLGGFASYLAGPALYALRNSESQAATPSAAGQPS